MIEAWDGGPFGGAKAAILCNGGLVAYLRDDRPDIPFPGLWDLPGGGREGEESPVETALREVHEEFGLRLESRQVMWSRKYPAPGYGNATTWFLVIEVAQADIDAIRFGDEGQRWSHMPIGRFLASARAVVDLQRRLEEYLRR